MILWNVLSSDLIIEIKGPSLHNPAKGRFMKVFIIALAASLMAVSSLAQGTIIFYNRDFSSPNPDGMSSAPIAGITDVATARAQLYLVTGSGAAAIYTPLTPLQTFRP